MRVIIGSYKLSPEGIAFLKPITLKFNYSGYNLDGTISEMLAPAYQDDKGLYHAPQEFVNDKAAKILSVSTTHFSNWTLYDWYRLDGPNVVGTEGNIRVKLMTYPFLSSLTEGEPLLQEWNEAKLDDESTPANEELKTAEWKLSGEGNLTPEGLKSLYHAPFDIPAMNPVMVSVSMTGKFEKNGPATTKYTLLHPVTIISDYYFTATIDGVQHNVSQATFVKTPTSYILSGLVDDKRLINLNINALSKGNFSFGKQGEAGKANLSYAYDNSNTKYAVSVRSACSTSEPSLVFSPGQVSITAFPQKAGENFTGSVSGALLYDQANFCTSEITKNISITFNVRTY